jgi:D-glycero-D-manno-heptose 1,7-bisphosphate phosphatase
MKEPIKRPAVFLDRDGVLTSMVIKYGLPVAPENVDDVKLLPGVVEACRDLASAGYALICVTNQPDVARGLQTRERVETINNLVKESLHLDSIRVCWHDDVDKCECRKPKPGLLIDAARDFGINLEQSFMVGDRWRDVEAGVRAGCKTVLVDHSYNEKKHDKVDLTVASLHQAVPWLLKNITP